jgi:hypothetical protein
MFKAGFNISDTTKWTINGSGSLVVDDVVNIGSGVDEVSIYTNVAGGVLVNSLATSAENVIIGGNKQFNITSIIPSNIVTFNASSNSGGINVAVINATVVGSSGNDVISISQNGTIYGGPGVDVITAVEGHLATNFVFNGVLDFSNSINSILGTSGSWLFNSTNIDQIVNFIPGSDKLFFPNILTRISDANFLYGSDTPVTLAEIESDLESSELEVSPGNVILVSYEEDLYFILNDGFPPKVFYNGSNFNSSELSIIRLTGALDTSPISSGEDWFAFPG